ncbi:MAG: hypothetical protein ACRDKZ_12150 [Actinomycetota bacterium]
MTLPILEHEASPRRSRSPMADHHYSARVWATAALLSVLLPAEARMGWWLPLHLLLVGAATQLIVGGHIMFSATLGVSRGPDRPVLLGQLALLNAGAAGIIGGRLFDLTILLGLGATALVAAIISAALITQELWRSALNRRFASVRVFYGLASISLLLGAGIGAAMAIGAFDGASSYAAHKLAHLALNLWGWAGMTILGTMMTLLPTVLHVRAPRASVVRAPWVFFVGLLTLAGGLTTDARVLALFGMLLIGAGIAPVTGYLREVLGTPRRRRFPGAGLQLVAAFGWLLVVATSQFVLVAADGTSQLRDLWVVGLGLGVVGQAVLGAWAFLLPAARPGTPELRRRELFVFEAGARTQAIGYNLGLLLMLAELLDVVPGAGPIGLAMVWPSSAWALVKCWAFRSMASRPGLAEAARDFWLPTDGRGVDSQEVLG